MSDEEVINLHKEENIAESAVLGSEAGLYSDEMLQADGRPIPVNSKELWAKMSPQEHYQRLFLIDDIEAWRHLGDLIWVLLKNEPRMYKILQRGGVTIEDQVRDVMTHIFKKIRGGSLHLKEPGKFYGLLKVIVLNCLRTVLRKSWVEDEVVPVELDELARKIPSAKDTPQEIQEKKEKKLLHKLLQKTIWEAVFSDAPIKNMKHRRALELSLRMKMETISIKNGTELAERLEQEFEEHVSYEKAASWVHSGMKQLRKYFKSIGLEPKFD
jgi:hypothetical protein